MISLFGALRRVLKDDGTVWLVIGDCYAGSAFRGLRKRRSAADTVDDEYGALKAKDLLGIPWMTAFALRKAGWFLRQEIIWEKANGMPESVRDRCTRSHEYVFMFSKKPVYYYDHLAIATPISASTERRMSQDLGNQRGSNRAYQKGNGPMKASFTKAPKGDGHGRRHEGFNARWDESAGSQLKVANRRSVWRVATSKSNEDHYASYPPEIPRRCIKAGSRPGDLVLDPFAGTGTTLLQASMLGRRYVGFDLNPRYVGIARRRLREVDGLFYQE
jgi:DNA modification methylase